MCDVYVPETLEQCKTNYLPPNYKYICCNEFGNPDGMVGSCIWCLEMTPYQFEMCNDESKIKSLCNNKKITRQEAIKLLSEQKERRYNNINE